MAIKVDGVTISEEAVQHELGRLIEFYSGHMSETEVRAQMPQLIKKAQDQAIGAKLLLDQASKMDIRVPLEETEKRMAEMITKVGGREIFLARLAEQNMSEDVVRQGLVQGRKVELLIAKITEGLSDPSEEEIREHYDTHAEEYTRPNRNAAQHIMLTPEDDSEAAQAVVMAQLEEIRRDIQQGASFEQEAASHSQCPSGKSTGGSLGWFAQGMMVPEFDEAVFRMRVGELSSVIKTSLGYHLIRKAGHEDGGKLEFGDVHDNIREFLRHSARGELVSQYVKDLKDKVTIEITD